ncbi:ABC-F family ATP-binding cassette domain-containing protein [Allonocardiopsis opalescens]|uniref:ATP-binding cassette subfamily F protein uup n=1 Tax=Allonocardiopsis opalescens TaxID=1144618 RepID=A0A2T0QD39_9ACTN|nr:ABC-F family ATP-binding cassette domain-containing protein [Allonocardiopsis opalescens]PRY01818.1 ATP-binding cassette subfamily F protein uup [Allonocardiopsis opalescens]
MNLVNLENVSLAYGPNVLLDSVSLGLDDTDRVGVVGRNGGGKSTLMGVVSGRVEPDSGRVTHTRALRLGQLLQRDEFPAGATVRGVVLGDRAEHDWAGDPRIRDVLTGLLPGWDLDVPLAERSGGERRRVALARLLIGEHDLVILDEPTNHLDIEAIDWLARHLRERRGALVVVTHDRWFLDAVTTRTWEVSDGQVHRYEGGYAAYVLAKAERQRQAAAAEERRQNLIRKELAWLRRGPPARTSKPKFRIDAANALIADEPPVRDTVELVTFAATRLGKTVYDVLDVTVRLDSGQPPIFDHLTWQLGPGDRIGLVGVNGAGKTTLLRLLAGEVAPEAGRVVRGKTVRLGHLSQELAELDPARRVLESVEEIRQHVRLGKREFTAGQMLERFGFRADRQWTPIGDLSGGERRRLQLLRLLMDEPNVILLDEPTNDLDIDTLNELEDLLDGWPGSLVLVSHDRYFLERITDRVLALLGDGGLAMLPGGVEEYLERRRSGGAVAQIPGRREAEQRAAETPRPAAAGPSAAEVRAARKEMQRVERRLERLGSRESELHEQLAASAADYARLAELDAELKALLAEKEQLEEEWLSAAEGAGE